MTSIYSPHLFSKLSSEWYLATALYDAIDDGNLREVAILLHDKHADPNVVIPDYDITPFHLAVGHENELFAKEVTKLLLKNGGDPNVKDNEGVTPLHVAAVWNRPNIVRILLSYGGDPMITDGAEKNAFHYAYEEHAWETLKTLEIHRRATTSKNEDKNERSYNIHLEKVIIQGDGVQAEYRTLCEGCRKDIVVSKQSVATQTPLPHIKLPEPNDSDDLETYFDAENISSSKIRPSCYDWCEQACGTVLTDDCKRKITSHRTKSRVYEYNPIFDRKTSNNINQPAHDYKRLMCCAVVSDLDNSKGDDILSAIESVEMKKLTKATIATSTSNLAEPKENGGENFSEDSLTSPKTQPKESLFDNISIPYIDESLTESSRNGDKCKSTTSEEKGKVVRIEEPPVTSELAPVPEPKEAAKHVSWSGCLSTCACIPNRLNESESSVYFTNPESDDEKSKIEPSSMLSGVHELSKTQNHSSLITNDESIPSIGKLALNEDKSVISNDESPRNTGKSFMTNDDKSLMSNDVSLINNAPSPRTGLNISIEFKYTDDEDGIEFVEARLPLYVSGSSSATSTPTKLLKKSIIGRMDESEASDGTAYDTDYIRTELKRLGFVSGPIAGTTKKLYLKKLRRIRKSVPDLEAPLIKPVFSPELEQVLREDNYEWEKTINKWSAYESDVLSHFSDTSFAATWRCGTAKTSFTYLLLDPRISDNLPARCEQMDLGDVWRDFIHAIFYVGKGTRARPYEHLHEAFLVWRETKAYPRKRCNLKVRHILDIWDDGLGVVCLQAFHNIIPAEAYTREAAMIDAIGLSRLKNEKGGMYYGAAASWNAKQKRRLGVYLLYRAMRMFIADNEVQLKPTDVK